MNAKRNWFSPESGARGFSRAGPALCCCLALLLASGHAARAAIDFGPFPEVDEAVEENVEESVEESVEEAIEDTVEDAVADNVDQIVEDIVEDTLDELDFGPFPDIEEKIEEDIEESFEENLEQIAEESVEEAVEDDIEESIAENLASDVEERVEDQVEAVVEAGVEESVEQVVEASVEESVEQVVESSVEESVESVVETSVEDTVEDTVEEGVEVEVAASVEQGLEENLEASVESNLQQSVEGDLEQSVEGAVAGAVEEQLEGQIEEIIDAIESDLEIDEDRIHKNQWLVMAEPEVFERLAKKGYLFDAITDLPGMGLALAEVAAPSSFDITEVRQGVIDVVGKDRAEVDLNHIYTAGDMISPETGEGVAPRTAVHFPEDIDELPLRIGMIDSQVDVAHPSLRKARLESRSFTPEGARTPNFHGTAIASIIAANAPEYLGLAPRAQLYAASVFQEDGERGEIASTVSLVRALDWLLSSQVDVVNISLAGPPNRLLEAALSRATARGLLVVAAAGNGGPASKPLYPAAYESVVAVTAVDQGGRVFRLANRGNYLDLAAPGVGMLHAKAGGGYTASSGTSFAVPFAAAAAARLRQVHPGDNTLQVLYDSAQDLGPPGRDEIYGYGLLRPGA